MPDTPTALGDVRVLDLTLGLGSYCAKLLADLGADVIKVEPPQGDPERLIGPFYHDEEDAEKSLSFFNLNTNKRGIVLDLDTGAGRAALRSLVPGAGVVVESFAPGYLDGLGLGYDGLCALRPDVILTSVTGFGGWGPHAQYLAPDIVGVAMAGLMWLAGDPRDAPNLPYGNQGEACASIQAAAGTMLALYHRDLTGEGQHVDVSMQEALLIAQERAMQTWDMNKAVVGRSGARVPLPFTVPGMGPYEASDGWIWAYLGTPGGAPWPEMLRWMEEQGLAEDLGEEPYRAIINELDLRFLTRVALSQEEREEKAPHLQHIHEVLKRYFAGKTKWELYEHGQRRRILLGIVSTPEDLVKNPQLNARAWYQEIDHAALGEALRYPGAPYRLSETPWRIARPAPRLGQHTGEVLAETAR